MNLFAGVVVDSFNNEKEKLGGLFFLENEQKEWVDIQKRIYELKPEQKQKIPKNYVRNKLYHFTNSYQFEIFIMLSILLNTVVFLIQWERMPKLMSTINQYLNLAFLGSIGLMSNWFSFLFGVPVEVHSD